MDALLADLSTFLASFGITAFRRKAPPFTKASDGPYITYAARISAMSEGEEVLLVEFDVWAYDTEDDTGQSVCADLTDQLHLAVAFKRVQDFTTRGTSSPFLRESSDPIPDPDDLEIAHVNSVYSAGTFTLR